MKSVTERFGYAIATRDGGWFCHYCGIALIPFDKWPIYGVPHDMRGCAIVAKSKGGKDELSNLVLACDDCNSKKGAMEYQDFLMRISQG